MLGLSLYMLVAVIWGAFVAKSATSYKLLKGLVYGFGWIIHLPIIGIAKAAGK